MRTQLRSVSPREIEILQLLSLGKNGKEMAKELYISLNTIKSHRKNLLEKLEAKNTAHLIRIALESKLIH